MLKVKKAVILAAGLGTRFLPATKSIPKVMFPLIDKPIIQIIVENIVESGVKDIIFVVSPYSYQSIKRQFVPFKYLNTVLKQKGMQGELEELKILENAANFSFVMQRKGRIGTGAAILAAKNIVGDEPFLLLFSDDFFLSEPNFITQLIKNYKDDKSVLLGCMKTKKPEDGNRFGFVVGKRIGKKLMKVGDLIEKPGTGLAPSDLASMVGMIFPPQMFDYLEEANNQIIKGKELYHTEGIKRMIKANIPVYALEYSNYKFYDTGDKLGYMKAIVEFGIKDKILGKDFRRFLSEIF